MPNYVIVCDLELAPFLEKYAHCTVTKTNEGTLIKTNDPCLCQCVANQLRKGYKLCFGSSYDEIILEGKFFTV